jgi:hypothetical protein
MTAGSGFDWFTGLAALNATCPPALASPGGMRQFFSAPNDAAFGGAVPRILMHESLHGFQLAGCSWLQRLVAEEWQRLRAFEATGTATPFGPLRTAWATPAPGLPYSVRDIAECLARFWDIHIRGPNTILGENEAQPAPYDYLAYEYALRAGAKLDSYPKPYLHIQIAAFHSPAIAKLGAAAPERNAVRASWATQLLFPLVGFLALNSADPVRAFVAGMDTILGDPDGLIIPTVATPDGSDAIELTWLSAWPQLSKHLAGALAEAGLTIEAHPLGLQNMPGWSDHPVWRHHASRAQALALHLNALAAAPAPDEPAWTTTRAHLIKYTLQANRFAVHAFPGLPDFRAALGCAFAPPLLRLADADIPASRAALQGAPWPLDDAALTAIVTESARRHRALRDADLAAKLGLPANAFVRA